MRGSAALNLCHFVMDASPRGSAERIALRFGHRNASPLLLCSGSSPLPQHGPMGKQSLGRAGGETIGEERAEKCFGRAVRQRPSCLPRPSSLAQADPTGSSAHVARPRVCPVGKCAAQLLGKLVYLRVVLRGVASSSSESRSGAETSIEAGADWLARPFDDQIGQILPWRPDRRNLKRRFAGVATTCSPRPRRMDHGARSRESSLNPG